MSMHPDKNYFKQFTFEGRKRTFVETGSYRGDGIQLAIDAGYTNIISIDIDPDNIDFCKHRFDLHRNPRADITLIVGDSAECLGAAISQIEKPTTFWLDSHWQMLEGTEPGSNPFPMLQELEQIRNHPVKEHTIFIDDMLIMQPDIVGYSNADVINALKKINPNYTMRYLPNPVVRGILVAIP
ncbi:MAG: hypothetical protein ACTHMM_17795 [Agriterribacter sp.]